MASKVILDFRPVYFAPFILIYEPIITSGLQEEVPFQAPPTPPTPPPAWSATPYQAGDDGNLNNPDDQYNSVNNFAAMLSRNTADGAGEYILQMRLGNYAWEYNNDTAASHTRPFNGKNQGTGYGACALTVSFSAGTPQNWNNFRGIYFPGDAWNPDYVDDNMFGDKAGNGRMQHQKGFKKFYFPKTGNGTKDGGWIGFFYHGEAFKNAVGGSIQSLEISQGHSVYTFGNVGTDAELVVRWDGMVGPKGQGPGVESWEECSEDTEFLPVDPVEVGKKRLWIDFNDLGTQTLDGSGRISGINDKIGYFTPLGFGQGDSDRRPKNDGTTYDGRIGAYFTDDNGEQDRMATKPELHMFDENDTSVHIFAVGIASDGNGTFISKANPAAGKSMWRFKKTLFGIYSSKSSAPDSEEAYAYEATNEAGTSDDVLSLVEGMWRPADSYHAMWRDGVEQIRATTPASSYQKVDYWNKIGCTGEGKSGFDGDILDIKIFANLTHAEVLWVRQNYQSLFPTELPDKGINLNHESES